MGNGEDEAEKELLRLEFFFSSSDSKNGLSKGQKAGDLVSQVRAFCFVSRTPKQFNEVFMGGGASSFFTRL